MVVALASATYFLAAETQKEMAIAQFDLTADHKEFEINRYISEQVTIVANIAELDELRNAADILLAEEIGSEEYEKAYFKLAEVLFLSTFLDYGLATASDLTEIFMMTKVGGRVFFSTQPSDEANTGLMINISLKGARKHFCRRCIRHRVLPHRL